MSTKGQERRLERLRRKTGCGWELIVAREGQSHVGRGKEPTTSVGIGIVVNLESRNDKQITVNNVVYVINKNRSRTTLLLSKKRQRVDNLKDEEKLPILSGEYIFDRSKKPWPFWICGVVLRGLPLLFRANWHAHDP